MYRSGESSIPLSQLGDVYQFIIAATATIAFLLTVLFFVVIISIIKTASETKKIRILLEELLDGVLPPDSPLNDSLPKELFKKDTSPVNKDK